jgi:hypothetical protein
MSKDLLQDKSSNSLLNQALVAGQELEFITFNVVKETVTERHSGGGGGGGGGGLILLALVLGSLHSQTSSCSTLAPLFLLPRNKLRGKPI